jgi:hypothetical protein
MVTSLKSRVVGVACCFDNWGGCIIEEWSGVIFESTKPKKKYPTAPPIVKIAGHGKYSTCNKGEAKRGGPT